MLVRIVAVVVVMSAGLAHAQMPTDLLKYAPSHYNTVTVVNVSAILQSPRARAEKWSEKHHTEYLAGGIPFHPSVDTIVSTVDFRPSARHGSLAAVLVPTKKPIDLAIVAKAVHGEATTANGVEVIRTPNRMYFVKLADQLLGGLYADQKTDVSRWLKTAQAKAEPPSAYLAKSLISAESTHFQIAVDVQDLYERNEVESALALSPDFPQLDDKTKAALVQFFDTLNGVRLTARVKEQAIQFSIILDGKGQLTLKPELLKAIVTEFLDRIGAPFQDIAASTATVDTGRFTLTFNVTDDELAHVAALVLPPPPPTGDVETIMIAPGTVNANITTRYLASVDKALAELKSKMKTANDYNKAAMWHDTTANRLVTLSVIGVAPGAIEFAHGTAAALRDVADSLQGVPLDVAKVGQKAYYYESSGLRTRWLPGFGFRFVPVGGVATNLPQIRQQQLEAIKKDQENRKAIWSQIEVRRKDVTISASEKK